MAYIKDIKDLCVLTILDIIRLMDERKDEEGRDKYVGIIAKLVEIYYKAWVIESDLSEPEKTKKQGG